MLPLSVYYTKLSFNSLLSSRSVRTWIKVVFILVEWTLALRTLHAALSFLSSRKVYSGAPLSSMKLSWNNCEPLVKIVVGKIQSWTASC